MDIVKGCHFQFNCVVNLLLDGAAVFKAAVARACQDLIASSQLLNELDAEVGDGDTGSTLANGAKCMYHNI